MRSSGWKHTKKAKRKISIKSKEYYRNNMHPSFKGVKFSSHGRKLIYCPNHPHCHKNKYVYEHRLIMEKYLGRYLKRDEDVHHVDGNIKNNKIKNLKVLSHKKHTSLHNKNRIFKAWIKRIKSKKFQKPENINDKAVFYINSKKRYTYIVNKCIKCNNLFWTSQHNPSTICCKFIKDRRLLYW